MVFADRIKALRIENGLTQMELADVLHVTGNTVVLWEIGKRESLLKMLSRVSAFFGGNCDRLVYTSMKEHDIERKLVDDVKRRGGIAWKFTSPGTAGMPDRIVLMPGGKMAFVELKAPGCKPRPLQLRRKAQLEALGFRVFVVDNADQIGGVLDDISAS
jgi:DNA-binding XRE family transcriptional regulator